MLNVSTFSLNNQISYDKYLLNSLKFYSFQLTKELDSYKVKYKELLVKFNKLNNEKDQSFKFENIDSSNNNCLKYLENDNNFKFDNLDNKDNIIYSIDNKDNKDICKICSRCKENKRFFEYGKKLSKLRTICKDCINKDRRDRYYRTKDL